MFVEETLIRSVAQLSA